MAKRARSVSSSSARAASSGNGVTKKTRSDVQFLPNKIATPENAAKADASPPLLQLLDALKEAPKKARKGECVVYWMRMEDLRSTWQCRYVPHPTFSKYIPVRDNRALSQASEQARRDGVPLIALHVFSPQDYLAHDRSARRIDFTLRNLKIIRVGSSLNLSIGETEVWA